MGVPIEAWESLGLVTAAVVAGFFSYVTIVASKESKLSELRQHWIDALRLEVSIVISRYRSLLDYRLMKEDGRVKHKDDPELVKREMELYSEALQAYFAIQMRINRKETTDSDMQLNQNFLDAVYSLKEYYDSGDADDFGGFAETLVEKSSNLLKHEWDRVRKGELAYRIAKYFSVAVLIGSLILVCYTANSLLRPAAASVSTDSQHSQVKTSTPTSSSVLMPPASTRIKQK